MRSRVCDGHSPGFIFSWRWTPWESPSWFARNRTSRGTVASVRCRTGRRSDVNSRTRFRCRWRVLRCCPPLRSGTTPRSGRPRAWVRLVAWRVGRIWTAQPVRRLSLSGGPSRGWRCEYTDKRCPCSAYRGTSDFDSAGTGPTSTIRRTAGSFQRPDWSCRAGSRQSWRRYLLPGTSFLEFVMAKKNVVDSREVLCDSGGS